MRTAHIPLLLLIAAALVAAEHTYTAFPSVAPILGDSHLPAALSNPDAIKWTAWAHEQDQAIRSRLIQGELDSMVNFLLLGTSFTKQTRVRVEAITEASKSGVLRARVDDLAAGLSSPGDNERLLFLSTLLRSQGVDPSAPTAGVFLYNHLLRVLEERRALAARAQKAAPSQLLDRESLFADRGVSLDTSILPNFSVEQTLRDLKARGLLREGQVTRVAIVGPGLDFIDKNEESAFDYYPEQTLQPFAIYDSLVRLKLVKVNALSVSVLDISSRVLDHIQRARTRKTDYVVQLPHDIARPWPPDLTAYWRAWGDQIGTSTTAIKPPGAFAGLESRAVRLRPEIVRALDPQDLNIVLQRLDLAPAERYDLIVGTNLFIYYNAFEQTLALENAGAMLKPGGLLLTNDRLPEVAHGAMRQAGATEVHFDDHSAPEAIGWYQRR